jgi:hypothetical protein
MTATVWAEIAAIAPVAFVAGLAVGLLISTRWRLVRRRRNHQEDSNDQRC